MKVITFGSIKRKFLVFEADDTEFRPDGEAYIVSAHGAITLQDAPAMEEILYAGRTPCRVTVEENGEELLYGEYLVTFLLLESASFVARLENTH